MEQMIDVCGVKQLGELRVRIPNELHKALKQLALDRSITLKNLIINILEEYVKENLKKEEK